MTNYNGNKKLQDERDIYLAKRIKSDLKGINSDRRIMLLASILAGETLANPDFDIGAVCCVVVKIHHEASIKAMRAELDACKEKLAKLEPA